jgi:hypothetical protein
MAQEPTNTNGKGGRVTTTLSVRLPLEQAETLRAQAKAKGYKNVNQYLVAVCDLIAPFVPAAPQEQVNNEPVPA